MKNNRGMTLVELMIVVAIIGILAAVGIPAYVGMQKRGAMSEGIAKVEELRLLQEQYYAENGQYAPPNPPAVNTPQFINYQATPAVPGDNGIEDFLPGFQPGGCNKSNDPTCIAPFGLEFMYTIQSQDTTGDGRANEYVITATGSGNRVENTVILQKDWQGN